MIGFQVKRTVLIGLKSLWLHRLRSFLTVLGMICGVCAVIAMLAIGEGASFEAQEQIRQLGSTNISILAVKPPEDASAPPQTSGGGMGAMAQVVQYGLTYEDAERIASTFRDVQVTVPVQKIPKTVWNNALHVDATVMGTVPWYTRIRNRKMIEGRFLTSTDMHEYNNVCVVEPGIVDALFPGGNALGKTVKISLSYYRVVGVMEASTAPGGEGGAGGGPGIYLPVTTAHMTFGELNVQQSTGSSTRERVELHEIIVNVPSVKEVLPMADNLREMLKRSHKKIDYKLDVPLERLQAAEKIKRTFNVVLGSIAAISLLVGGIGIMNIMLASVTERNVEIGIRRALGAKKKHIITQFLTETVLLSGVGGILGVAIGVIIPAGVEHFAGMKTIVTLWSPIAAFTISGFVGIVFGIYPAYRAANMDPIEALRHE